MEICVYFFLINMSSQNFQEHIIIPALQLIRHDTKVKKFYFFPGMLSILFLSMILVYQSIYTYVEILGKKEEALEIILNFLHSQYATEAIIAVTICILWYIAIIPIFEWGLIRYIDQKVSGQNASTSDSFGYGVFRFYPMFEYNNIFSMFKFMSIINALLFTIRFVGVSYLNYAIIIACIAIFFSLIINTITAYTKYEIVLQNKTVFQAIGTSARIALLNLKTTLRLYFLMFVVNIRVIFNFIIFLLFPLLFVGAIGFITSTVFLTITIIILSILFAWLVILLWYMTTVLEVFTSATWYFAYKEGRKKLELANADKD